MVTGYSKACLGVLTLGQSPRPDITPTLKAVLGGGVSILEAGGLDGLSSEAVASLAPMPGETPIETRLQSGKPVLLSKDRLIPRLAEMAISIKSQCSRVLLLCSGDFPELSDACPGLIFPVHLLRGVVKSMAAGLTLGVMGPASDMDRAPEQWRPMARRVVCDAASPYDPSAMIEAAAIRLNWAGADIILLDDMAFTDEHRRIAAAASSKPVICAAAVTARVLSDIL